MLATDLWQNLKETASADQIKRLRELNESEGKGHLLFAAALLLENLSNGEDHVYDYVDVSARKPHAL